MVNTIAYVFSCCRKTFWHQQSSKAEQNWCRTIEYKRTQRPATTSKLFKHRKKTSSHFSSKQITHALRVSTANKYQQQQPDQLFQGFRNSIRCRRVSCCSHPTENRHHLVIPNAAKKIVFFAVETNSNWVTFIISSTSSWKLIRTKTYPNRNLPVQYIHVKK